MILAEKMSTFDTIRAMIKYIILSALIIVSGLIFMGLFPHPTSISVPFSQVSTSPVIRFPTAMPTKTPIPLKKLLQNDYHIFQTFNNCGPAALSMALSYFGLQVSQDTLGKELRPYQNPRGDNDDKSVTLGELAEKAKEYGFIPYHRPNGSIQVLKELIALDIPILTRTWLKVDDDIGHFRVIKGYDDEREVLIQDDSLQGHNKEFSYNDFLSMWQKFNYEYLVLVPQDKRSIIVGILGDNADEAKAWKLAVRNAEEDLLSNPDDIYTRFNLSVALYHTGELQKSIMEYERVENRLPMRTLWYQIEPLQAYYAMGHYESVLKRTEKILNNHNRAFSELYVLRGNVYKNQGDIVKAKEEFEKAVLYNKNSKMATAALESL